MLKYFAQLESGKINLVTDEASNLYEDLNSLLGFEISPNSTILALKFEYEDAENLYFCYCEHGTKSLMRMLCECSQTDATIKHYLLASMHISSRILLQFTIDKIDKNMIFFDLLDLENIMFSNSIGLMTSMLYFTYRDEENVSILRGCDQEYKNLNENTSLLYFTNTKTAINMKKYNYGIEVNEPLKDLYSVSNSICFI